MDFIARGTLRTVIFALLAGAIGPNACTGLVNTEPFVDATKDAQGNIIFLDTPRMWRDWVEVVDGYVAEEQAGEHPPGGVPSWNAFWLSMIQSNSDRENAPKYVACIVDKRRTAGLPELVGYPDK